MKKVCGKCKEEKDVSEFHSYKRMKDGLQPHCKVCINEIYKLKPISEKKKKSWVEQTKKKKERNSLRNVDYKNQLGGKCVKCGDKRIYVLDYHHLDPSKKLDHVSSLIERNKKLAEEEIKKCILLCACCHREFHHLERENGITIEEYTRSLA